MDLQRCSPVDLVDQIFQPKSNSVTLLQLIWLRFPLIWLIIEEPFQQVRLKKRTFRCATRRSQTNPFDYGRTQTNQAVIIDHFKRKWLELQSSVAEIIRTLSDRNNRSRQTTIQEPYVKMQLIRQNRLKNLLCMTRPELTQLLLPVGNIFI